MKNENMNKGIKDIRQITLDQAEKEKILRNLLLHTKPLKSPFAFKNALRYSLVGALAVLLVGGTSFAAGHALPGDVLYPVKLRFNEPIQGFFKFSPQAKAEWEGEKAVKRIKEVEHLIQKGNEKQKEKIEHPSEENKIDNLEKKENKEKEKKEKKL